jgi:hypothetical protein
MATRPVHIERQHGWKRPHELTLTPTRKSSFIVVPEAGDDTDGTDAMGLGVGVDLAGEIILGPERRSWSRGT